MIGCLRYERLCCYILRLILGLSYGFDGVFMLWILYVFVIWVVSLRMWLDLDGWNVNILMWLLKFLVIFYVFFYVVLLFCDFLVFFFVFYSGYCEGVLFLWIVSSWSIGFVGVVNIGFGVVVLFFSILFFVVV